MSEKSQDPASPRSRRRGEELIQAIHAAVLAGIAVGGGSDGNFTAAAGVPTLDGLGAIGDGAHAAHEHVDVTALPWRAALVAGLLASFRDPSA